MHTVDYDKYKYGGVNITGLRMIDPAKRDTIEAINKWSNWEMNSGKVEEIVSDKLDSSPSLRLGLGLGLG